ncbi:MAG: N-acetylmannosamine kinase [Devosia sp. 67-54]|uniref:putative N-acetylmannosamine-6-phosphate 2-epimerase n=1 Tax=unclassified Devosia TaxID=196773 RepID=UPI00096376BA|nr:MULTISPECIES: putative N-acetylmannosamine-6-phosphate 2-epimerase [unclassified Devosia]MBN9306656.1 putative N-acetylmannosamine-6-phosphate 2-epimerase [Devosia sp.]OJX15930.1 MAG: N-acetylmannosamine kinase [Devosia sp. 67-54]
MTALLDQLKDGLIVSCQPVDDGPMDTPAIVAAMALAAGAGGARALRVEGADNVAAVMQRCDLPVIGIVKRDLADSAVRITPWLDDVQALAAAGARIIAVDGTARARPVSVGELLAAIRATGCLAMADIATLEEARAARAMGFDIVGTTLSGYTGGPVPAAPDLQLVADCAALGGVVVAEGRYNTPALAAAALTAGATAVCVGSAVTRQEHVTQWFDTAIAKAAAARERTVLALDIGGTKSLLALVRNGSVLEERLARTEGPVGTPPWFVALGALAAGWAGRYDAVGAAVTGRVHDGAWRALNPGTLAIPESTPLLDRLRRTFGTAAVLACNDAQAAAWGEYRFGAGRGRDTLFLTVSSGIGGGIVRGGALVTGSTGLAGSVGQLRGPDGQRFETRASGFGLSAAARAIGRPDDTRAIFAADAAGEAWAAELIAAAAREMAAMLVNLQLLVDPDVIVLGGGIGLLPAYRRRIEQDLSSSTAPTRPTLVAAALGTHAGILGIGDLAAQQSADDATAGPSLSG